MTNQNDFVIDNGTGFAVRQDIQDALQALAGNSSGNSEPSVKYAYQWWADSNANVMKLRNSGNTAWIELFQLDGTLTLENGSATAPALAFRDDLNTGIYSAANDRLNIVTEGIDRLEVRSDAVVFNDTGADTDFIVESDGNANCFTVDAGKSSVGINVAPATGYGLDILGNSGYDDVLRLTGVGTNIGPRMNLTPTGSGSPRINATSGLFQFQVGGVTQMTIGNTGTKPVLIGTTVINTNDKLTVLDAGDVFMSIRSDAAADNTRQFLDFGTATADRSSLNQTGCIFATIHSQSGGTLKSDLAFQTNSGNSINTKMTIKDTGQLGVGTTSPDHFISVVAANSATPRLGITNPTYPENINISSYHDSSGIYGYIGANAKLNSSGNLAVDTTDHKSSGIHIDARNSGSIQVHTGGTGGNPVERLRISDGGKFGLGVSSVGSAFIEARENNPVAGRLLALGSNGTASTTNASGMSNALVLFRVRVEVAPNTTTDLVSGYGGSLVLITMVNNGGDDVQQTRVRTHAWSTTSELFFNTYGSNQPQVSFTVSGGVLKVNHNHTGNIFFNCAGFIITGPQTG